MHSKWPLSGKLEVWSVPRADGGGNRERPFARQHENGKPDIRYSVWFMLLYRDTTPFAAQGHLYFFLLSAVTGHILPAMLKLAI